MAIPNTITRRHVISAINRIDPPDTIPSNRQPRKLALRYNNRNYPVKFVLCIAHEIATSRELSHKAFTTHMACDFINALGGFTIVRIQD
jgi:hypothetical protein